MLLIHGCILRSVYCTYTITKIKGNTIYLKHSTVPIVKHALQFGDCIKLITERKLIKGD